MDLPDPGGLTYYTLESPWMPAGVLLIGAVGCAVMGRRTEQMTLLYAGVGLLGGTVALMVAAWLVQTDREQIMSRTERLVDATRGEPDMDALRDLMGPDARLWHLTRDPLISTLGKLDGRYSIKGHSITMLKGAMNGETTGQTQLKLTTVIAMSTGRFPVHTEWMFNWRKQADGAWRIGPIDWRSVNQSSPNVQLLPRP